MDIRFYKCTSDDLYMFKNKEPLSYPTQVIPKHFNMDYENPVIKVGTVPSGANYFVLGNKPYFLDSVEKVEGDGRFNIVKGHSDVLAIAYDYQNNIKGIVERSNNISSDLNMIDDRVKYSSARDYHKFEGSYTFPDARTHQYLFTIG